MVTAAICNVLAFIIMIHLGLRRTPTYFTLVLATVTDTLVLVATAGRAWVLEVTHGYDFIYKLMTDSDMTCKCYNFTFGVLSQLSMWLVAMGAMDASILVERLRIYKRRVLSRIKTSFLVVITAILLTNSHCFWTFHQQAIKTPEGNLSGFTCGFNDAESAAMYSKEYRDYVWPISNIIMTYIIPFALIATSIWRFYRTKSVDVPGSPPPGVDDKTLNPKMLVCVDPADIKRMFVALGIFCIIMNLPDCLFTLVTSFFVNKERHLTFDRVRYTEIIKVICHTFGHMARAMKLLVCLMTSTHCRDALFSLGKQKQQHKQMQYDMVDQKYKTLNTQT